MEEDYDRRSARVVVVPQSRLRSLPFVLSILIPVRIYWQVLCSTNALLLPANFYDVIVKCLVSSICL